MTNLYREMLNGWTARRWMRGEFGGHGRTCLLGRYHQVKTGKSWMTNQVVVVESDLADLISVIRENWPVEGNGPTANLFAADGAVGEVVHFNDLRAKNFQDIRAALEKAAVRFEERV